MLAVMVLVFVLAGCTMVGQADECGDGAACVRKTPRTEQQPPRREPTVITNREQTVLPSERTVFRNIFTGTITEARRTEAKSPKRILVERPRADDNRRPCDEAMGFTITNKTRVLRETASNRKAVASVTDLRQGQRVRADYTGNEVATTCIGQTTARSIIILDPR